MQNAVIPIRTSLEKRHYCRQARGKNYSVDFAKSDMESLCDRYGPDFYLVIHGKEDEEHDYFVIPYPVVQRALTPKTLAKPRPGKTERTRWTGTISRRGLKVANCESRLDLDPFRGNRRFLNHAAGGYGPQTYLDPEAYLYPGDADQAEIADGGADASDPYVPMPGDRRAAVMRQIKVRRGRKQFRDALRKRYGDRCMISGCRLMDVVEAAHIRPHRGDDDHHRANGLLLRADLHTLFDLDLIGIDPEALTVHLNPSVSGAGYDTFEGAALKCDEDTPSKEALSIRWEAFRARVTGTK